jgi:hypothetical protein
MMHQSLASLYKLASCWSMSKSQWWSYKPVHILEWRRQIQSRDVSTCELCMSNKVFIRKSCGKFRMYKQKRRNVRGLANAPFWSLAIADSTHRGNTRQQLARPNKFPVNCGVSRTRRFMDFGGVCHCHHAATKSNKAKEVNNATALMLTLD